MTSPRPDHPHSGLLLGRLLEEISFTVAPTESIVAYAEMIKRELNAVPRMSIQVIDWNRGRLLSGTPYVGEPVLTGTLEDALRIAGDLYGRGLGVMLQRTPEGIRVAVDDQGFRMR